MKTLANFFTLALVVLLALVSTNTYAGNVTTESLSERATYVPAFLPPLPPIFINVGQTRTGVVPNRSTQVYSTPGPVATGEVLVDMEKLAGHNGARVKVYRKSGGSPRVFVGGYNFPVGTGSVGATRSLLVSGVSGQRIIVEIEGTKAGTKFGYKLKLRIY